MLVPVAQVLSPGARYDEEQPGELLEIASLLALPLAFFHYSGIEGPLTFPLQRLCLLIQLCRLLATPESLEFANSNREIEDEALRKSRDQSRNSIVNYKSATDQPTPNSSRRPLLATASD